MKSLEIIGFKRANLGKKEAKRLRQEGNVPCVIYGGKDEVHFYAPMILFRDLVYTPEIHEVELNVEGDIRKCILQDIQFHPVSDIILHADFLELQDDKEIKMEVPVKLEGTPIGVSKGGKVSMKLRTLKVRALPANMPDFIPVQVAKLDLGKSVKVGQIKPENYTILTSDLVSIASIAIPRGLRGDAGGADEELEESAEEEA